MRFTTAVAATMATTVAAQQYGGWNVTIQFTDDLQRAETLEAAYAHSTLNDNINTVCNFKDDKTTCSTEGFSYELLLTDNQDRFQYQLHLTQTVDISGTKTTVRGASEIFQSSCPGEDTKDCSASSIIVPVTSAVA